jgi:cytochrome c biogenesis protein CcmG/thiol:disulfide interchange protein DsbE
LRRGRAASLPLVLAVGAFAALAGLFAWLRPPAEPALRVGSPAPALRLSDLAGAEVALADLRGSVVFVNFWGTWCPPCRDEAPALERLFRELGGEGFSILAVSIDEAGATAQVEAFREEFGLSFPILLDPGREAYAAFGATGVPETFVVDPAGRVVERYVGPRDWEQPRYARAVRRMLEAARAAERGG